MTPTSGATDLAGSPAIPSAAHTSERSAAAARGGRLRRGGMLGYAVVVGVVLLLWVPRVGGPIDLRWDAGVYYLLGTSINEGKGYRILSEPGEIADVQYPPLLPAIVAAHQRLLGTNDPTTVGRWLRLTSFLAYLAYGLVVLRFLRFYLRPPDALLGTLISVFCLHAMFLSDVLFPEIWFSLSTLLFLMSAAHHDRRSSVLAYVCALASYALRTIGIVAFAAWVLDSLLRRRFKQAVLRGVLALLPVLAWQSYVASVERSEAYNHPAYEYQRAPYLFYNVSYARNIVLMDPFTPENGPVRIVRRVVDNAVTIPFRVAETLSSPRGYMQMALQAVLGMGPRAWYLIDWVVFLAMTVWALLVAAGLATLLVRRQWLLPSYVLLYILALCLTPFPDQYLRYLMPIAPLLAALALLLPGALAPLTRDGERRSWSWIRTPSFVLMGPAALVSIGAAAYVYTREHQPIAYVDIKGEPVAYRMFFYDDGKRGFDEATDYVRDHTPKGGIVAAGTPHWIYLRTGLMAVMPPFEPDVEEAQRLLDGVPVLHLIVGRDVAGTERYTAPVVKRFADRWQPVFTTENGGWTVYRRAGR
jgi:hypothetical protein